MDLIAVPDDVAENVEIVTQQFFRWMANQNNDHNFWSTENNLGIKSLALDTDAYLWWLNKHYIKSNEKAYLVSSHVKFHKDLPFADF